MIYLLFLHTKYVFKIESAILRATFRKECLQKNSHILSFDSKTLVNGTLVHENPCKNDSSPLCFFGTIDNKSQKPWLVIATYGLSNSLKKALKSLFSLFINEIFARFYNEFERVEKMYTNFKKYFILNVIYLKFIKMYLR